MRYLVLMLLLVLAVIGCSKKSTQSTTPPVDFEVIRWVGTEVLYSDAEADGKKDVSLLFVLVSWCGHCNHLKSETLKDSTVITTLNSRFNCAQIDGDSDSLVVHGDSTVTCREMRSTIYGVSGYPTIVVLDRSGIETTRILGYKSPEQFVAILNEL